MATARPVRGWHAGPGPVAAPAFDPQGSVLASAHLGTPGEVRLWDPTTGQELLSLEGHKAQVNGLAFSPDGSVLASCSHDGAVRLWRSRP